MIGMRVLKDLYLLYIPNIAYLAGFRKRVQPYPFLLAPRCPAMKLL